MNTQKIKKFFEKILLEIFVDKYNCIVCDRELENQSKYGLCPDCLKKTAFIKDKICLKCGRLQSNEADYCITCQNHKRYFDMARSCIVYDGIAKEIVRGLKFGRKKYFAKYMSVFLQERFEECFKDVKIDYIVPVPLMKKRRRERGYNQAEAIAKKFSERSSIPMRVDVVIKKVQNKEQAKLAGEEREQNVLGVYGVEKPQDVKGKSILIIDDVMTTGSTASELARIMKVAKAEAVYLLTFASTKYKITGETCVIEEVE